MNVIREGLENLRTKGWWKYGDENLDKVCILTSMPITGFNIPVGETMHVGDFLCVAIAELYPNRPGGPASFNDHPDTTQEDVERVMELAANKLDERMSNNG